MKLADFFGLATEGGIEYLQFYHLGTAGNSTFLKVLVKLTKVSFQLDRNLSKLKLTNLVSFIRLLRSPY